MIDRPISSADGGNLSSKDIRELLPRSWFPFFSRFGTLTSVQRAVIPEILSGANVVVESPTASGKTEAVLAPIAELIGRRSGENPVILYIAPTRALVNDTQHRISNPLTELGIEVAAKHGDRPALTSRSIGCLITTPESFDSLLCRHSDRLSDVQHVIIDEIHLLDNTYRGDQLRVLLHRLRALRHEHTLHVHLLSATMGNAAVMARRYTDTSSVITVPGQREIDLHLVEELAEVKAFARDHDLRKLLCFCNARKRVDVSADELSRLFHPIKVVAHHGSLSAHERLEAEDLMKDGSFAVCVATSTLEIGIDIGDIDAVVLLQPPVSVSAFMQRVGRGNRRRNRITALALAESAEEREIFTNMLDAARSGRWGMPAYSPDLSVVVQQAYSILYQNPGGVKEPSLLDLLKPLCDGKVATEILNHLLEIGKLEHHGGAWFASTRVMDLGEKGLIHANIPSSFERRVVDVTTGKLVGLIDSAPDVVFLLAGRAWQVVTVSFFVIRVKPYTGRAAAANYSRRIEVGRFFTDLPSVFQDGITGGIKGQS